MNTSPLGHLQPSRAHSNNAFSCSLLIKLVAAIALLAIGALGIVGILHQHSMVNLCSSFRWLQHIPTALQNLFK
ncbi:MAG: hypothetical protein JSS62_00825, partial [Verrucomicrobia bacterium]|nr:hypothetical protein [Verrucomicrobiota bacterium]